MSINMHLSTFTSDVLGLREVSAKTDQAHEDSEAEKRAASCELLHSSVCWKTGTLTADVSGSSSAAPTEAERDTAASSERWSQNMNKKTTNIYDHQSRHVETCSTICSFLELLMFLFLSFGVKNQTFTCCWEPQVPLTASSHCVCCLYGSLWGWIRVSSVFHSLSGSCMLSFLPGGGLKCHHTWSFNSLPHYVLFGC